MSDDSPAGDPEDPAGDPEGERADGAPDLSTDRIFSLLSNERRRQTVRILEEHGHVTLPDIAEEVSVEQTGREITDIPPEAVRDTYMMLYHSDVPHLQDAGVITYDQERDVVATGPNFERVATVLARTAFE